MGYALYDQNKPVENNILDLTYTCLRNVLYDLSAKYPDKKLYVHQMSCRSGDYSVYHQKVHRQLKSIRQNQPFNIDVLHTIFGNKDQELREIADAEVDELTRNIGAMDIHREDPTLTFTTELQTELVNQGYKYVGYYPISHNG
jgi:hypothetical protein